MSNNKKININTDSIDDEEKLDSNDEIEKELLSPIYKQEENKEFPTSKSFLEAIKKKQIKADTLKWKYIRKHKITGSKGAAVLNIGPMTRLDLYKKLIGINIEPNLDVLNIEAMIWGTMLEPLAKKLFHEIYGKRIYDLGFIEHPKYNFLGATPDGILKNGTLVEIKCPYTRNINDDIPEHYKIQCQLQMEVWDLNECIFFQCNFREINKDQYNTYLKSDFLIGKLNNNESDDSVDNRYFILIDYRKDIIKRDKEWFSKNLPEFQKLWNEVENYKKNPRKRRREEIEDLEKNYQDLNIPITNKNRRKIYQYSSGINKNLSSSINLVYNYIYNDPIVLWLELFGKDYGYQKDKDGFQKFFSEKRRIFKKKIFNYINSLLEKRNVDEDIIEKEKKSYYQNEVLSEDEFNSLEENKKPIFYQVMEIGANISHSAQIRTIKAIKADYPIISNGVFFDDKTRMYGKFDLMVKGEYISKLFHKLEPEIELMLKNKNNKNKYYFIDITYRKINLCFDNWTLRYEQFLDTIKSKYHSLRYIFSNYFKGDLKNKNKIGNKCFIIGKQYSCVKMVNKEKIINCENNCFARGICIDYNKELITNVELGFHLINKLRNIPKDERHPENNPFLGFRPNMKRKTMNWESAKKEIAVTQGEISILWKVPQTDRDYSWKNSKYSIYDKDFNISYLPNSSKSKSSKIISRMISINRLETDSLIRIYNKPVLLPKDPTTGKDIYIPIYVDFETMPDVYDDFKSFPECRGPSLYFYVWVRMVFGR